MIRILVTVRMFRVFFTVLFLVSLLGCHFTSGRSEISYDQNEALLEAVEADNLEMAITLLDKGADPNAKRSEGSNLTVLMLAARNGNSRLVKELLTDGSDPNITAAVAVGVSHVNEGITALMLSAASGDAKTMQILLNYGANALVKDSTGNTLLHYAVEKQGAIDVVRLALAHGVDRNAKNAQGQTALDKAKAAGNYEIISELMY
ncbi:ankyrin repeat [Methyloglobulus morosus KoM1]|uniref:Ankyrin repeat n=1 Tax=Methyloglobulus morosus KoM1 TaxID=1116472 RepID=V5BEF2_9GAMM|nr:ankyrin repeat domain-containing protein [Methyloglobulus morosus]ESS71650.1 ankyrin repeat [Methyloglobulus morosus KoM1]